MVATENDVTVAQVLAMEDARYAAMVAGDIPALERMSADDLAYTHSHGGLDGKAGYLAAMRAGKFTYRRIERLEAEVSLLPGAALLSGRIELDVLFDTGPRVLKSCFLSVWLRSGADWRHLAWQSTPVPG